MKWKKKIVIRRKIYFTHILSHIQISERLDIVKYLIRNCDRAILRTMEVQKLLQQQKKVDNV